MRSRRCWFEYALWNLEAQEHVSPKPELMHVERQGAQCDGSRVRSANGRSSVSLQSVVLGEASRLTDMTVFGRRRSRIVEHSSMTKDGGVGKLPLVVGRPVSHKACIKVPTFHAGVIFKNRGGRGTVYPFPRPDLKMGAPYDVRNPRTLRAEPSTDLACRLLG